MTHERSSVRAGLMSRRTAECRGRVATLARMDHSHTHDSYAASTGGMTDSTHERNTRTQGEDRCLTSVECSRVGMSDVERGSHSGTINNTSRSLVGMQLVIERVHFARGFCPRRSSTLGTGANTTVQAVISLSSKYWVCRSATGGIRKSKR